MSCVFCQIAAGEKPARVFHEDDEIIVFADILPRAAIHLLICPRAHYTTLLELPDDLSIKLLETARQISRELSIEDNFRLILNNGAKAGQIIEHLHFHFLSNSQSAKIVYKS